MWEVHCGLRICKTKKRVHSLVLVVFNFDPVGDGLEKIFGKGADRWAINIVLIALIAHTFIKKK